MEKKSSRRYTKSQASRKERIDTRKFASSLILKTEIREAIASHTKSGHKFVGMTTKGSFIDLQFEREEENKR